MGQLPSSLKGSRDSVQSENIDTKFNNRKLKKKAYKESFRRHSILNLFNNNNKSNNNSRNNSGTSSPISTHTKSSKLNTKSDLNLNQINSSTKSLHISNKNNSDR